MPHRLPLAVLTLLGLSITAQAAPKADPAAKVALTQMSTAYQQLGAFSCTVAALQDGQKTQTSLYFKRPDLASVTTTGANGLIAEAVSDGSSLYQVGADGKQYTVASVTAGQGISSVLSADSDPLVLLLARPEAILPSLLSHATMGTARQVNGALTDTVLITLPSEQITFSLGPDDHLIRQLTFAVAVTDGAKTTYLTKLTDTVMDFNAAPTLTTADFTFTPPAGAQKVDSLQPPTYDPRLKVGADPFAITATDLSGKPVTLDAYKGKVVLLDFWATWCPPCRGEIPNIVAAYDKYHTLGFDIVGVSLDQANDRPALEKFLTQNHMTWRQIYDGGGWGSKVAHQYGVQAIPFSLLIGKDGTIVGLGDDIRGPGLAPAVQEALAQKTAK